MPAPAFDNSYARLPERFFARLDPVPVKRPKLLFLNRPLAIDLGLDPEWLAGEDGVAMLAGTRMPAGAQPIAQAYAGHQFGGFSPQLGDGRAHLLGEIVDPAGRRFDVQLKGSGPTPFSRRGDGRAALGPVLRECIIAEALHALGIPTTRSLAAVATGEPVVRETVLPGGVLTRVAASHIRVGTFQYFAARGDTEAIRVLVEHVVARHGYSAATASDQPRALLAGVIQRQARLIARWLGVGFIHGVMNTDNMTVSGESIDFGPCAFMDAYDPAQVYSSIDHQGRYAFGAQPSIAMWNLTRFAETLLPLLAEDQDAAVREAQAIVETYPDAFRAAYADVMRAKLGITMPADDDLAIVQGLFDAMAAGKADFTLTFRHLTAAVTDPAALARVSDVPGDRAPIEAWLAGPWAQLGERHGSTGDRAAVMRAANPAFIPRNHQVEAALGAAVDHGDLRRFERLLGVLAQPYDDQPGAADLAVPPREDEIVRATFCGT
jgi:uncharacterized protein YdiU (UPF0061 family)